MTTAVPATCPTGVSSPATVAPMARPARFAGRPRGSQVGRPGVGVLDALDPVVAAQSLDGGAGVHRDVVGLQFLHDGVADHFAERRERSLRSLEEMDPCSLHPKRLAHLDADVAAADDGDGQGRLPVGVAGEAVGVDHPSPVVGVLRLVGALGFEERPHRGRIVESVEGERALQVRPLDGRVDGAGAGRDQQVAVPPFDLPVRPVDRDGPVVRVDVDDLAFAAEVDVPLLDLLRRQREQVGERRDGTRHVVGRPAVGVGDPPTLLEDDDVAVRVLASTLARGAEAGGVPADDDEGVGHRRYLRTRWLSCTAREPSSPRPALAVQRGSCPGSPAWRMYSTAMPVMGASEAWAASRALSR